MPPAETALQRWQRGGQTSFLMGNNIPKQIVKQLKVLKAEGLWVKGR